MSLKDLCANLQNHLKQRKFVPCAALVKRSLTLKTGTACQALDCLVTGTEIL